MKIVDSAALYVTSHVGSRPRSFTVSDNRVFCVLVAVTVTIKRPRPTERLRGLTADSISTILQSCWTLKLLKKELRRKSEKNLERQKLQAQNLK